MLSFQSLNICFRFLNIKKEFSNQQVQTSVMWILNNQLIFSYLPDLVFTIEHK